MQDGIVCDPVLINVVVSSQKVVTALDRTWHPEHFFCAQCGSFFGPEGILLLLELRVEFVVNVV